MINNKIIIYQVFTRLYGNRITKRKPNGTLAENGSGKFADFDEKPLGDESVESLPPFWEARGVYSVASPQAEKRALLEIFERRDFCRLVCD